MQIAHLILAHKNPTQLKRLIASISNADSLIFVHIDLKTKIDSFKGLEGLPNVAFIKKRISVNWGGYSQVQVVLNSFKEILHQMPAVSYINLLSGQDYPIVKVDRFHEFLKASPDFTYMEYREEPSKWIYEAKARFSQYHLTDMSLPGKYKVEKLLNWVLPKRNWPSNFQLVGRSTWFTMSRECTEYILKFVSENKKFLKCFKLSWGADELFFQTILFNSPLRPKLINNNLRYIDWSEGKPNPKLLSENDIHKIEVSVCFFARKFNEEDKVLDYLDKRL